MHLGTMSDAFNPAMALSHSGRLDRSCLAQEGTSLDGLGLWLQQDEFHVCRELCLYIGNNHTVANDDETKSCFALR